jgi:hypothetical protein
MPCAGRLKNTGFVGTGSSGRSTGASALMRTTMSSSLSPLPGLPIVREMPAPYSMPASFRMLSITSRGVVSSTSGMSFALPIFRCAPSPSRRGVYRPPQ